MTDSGAARGASLQEPGAQPPRARRVRCDAGPWRASEAMGGRCVAVQVSDLNRDVSVWLLHARQISCLHQLKYRARKCHGSRRRCR